MNNPGGLILVAPFAWGLYKCSVLARRPTTNTKAVYALAAMLGVWIVLLTSVAISGGAAGEAQIVFAGAVLFTGAPIVASVLAVLGLYEIWRARRAQGERAPAKYVQGAWQAIGALVLAAMLLVPFALYAGAHLFGKRG